MGDVRRILSLVLSIAVVVVVLDQVSKAAILSSFRPGELFVVIPGFFNLTLHFNPGVAFGLFADLEEGIRSAVLLATTSVAVSFVLFFLFTEYRNSRTGQCALALVLGGAIGNVIDRFNMGQVVDFLDFHIGDAHWPTFNVADSCICIGVGILLLQGLLQRPIVAPGEQDSAVIKEADSADDSKPAA